MEIIYIYSPYCSIIYIIHIYSFKYYCSITHTHIHTHTYSFPGINSVDWNSEIVLNTYTDKFFKRISTTQKNLERVQAEK